MVTRTRLIPSWRLPRGAALLAVLLSALPAAAQLGGESLEPDAQRVLLPVGPTGALALPGSWRLWGGYVGGMAVAAEDPAVGETTDAEHLIESRLRLQPALVLQGRGLIKLWRVAADTELHITLGDLKAPVGLENDPRWIFREDQPVLRLTRLYAVAAAEHFVVRVGLDRSQFGLGLLANAGEDAPAGLVRQSAFGVGRHGDRVARGQVTLLPQGLVAGSRPGESLRAPLAIALAVDGIIDDDSASWADGDRAVQFLGGLFSQLEAGHVGGGIAHRRQTHADGGETVVNIGLLTGGVQHDLEGGRRLFMEVEAAGYLGHTNYVQSAIRKGNFDILSAGGATRVGVEGPAYNALVEVGFASGDANPFDDELHGFTFDRDYRLGLLMFQEGLRATTAITAHNVADPRFRGRPPRGYDALATDGGVTNARYFNPRAGWRVRDDVTLQLGYLVATTDEPYADPFRSGLAGGGPVGPRGAVNQTYLGQELDFGVAWEPAWPPMGARVRAQGAWFVPGEVFNDAEGQAADSMMGGFLQVEGRW